MNLSISQKAILVGALAGIMRLRRGKTPVAACRRDWSEIQQQQEREYALENIIRTEPGRWLGKVLTPADYVMLSRDYVALENKGLIHRRRLGVSGGRQTHIELTKAGLKLARQLEDEGAGDG